MPSVFESGGFRFFFYANEGSPREPPHIHIRHAAREAKVWLRPGLPEAYNYGFTACQLRAIRELVEANREQIEAAWDEFTLVRPVGVTFESGRMNVELSDGRTLGVPLSWFPRLLHASGEQLEKCELSPYGLHWEQLDEDISVAGLLGGRGDRTRRHPEAAK